MPDRICPRCERTYTYKREGRGNWPRFCSSLCAEAARHKPLLPACSVQGCERTAKSSVASYCEMHYTRLRRTGSLDSTRPKRAARGQCIHPDCDALDAGRQGLCSKHLSRLLRHGDPNVVLPRGSAPGPSHFAWKGDDIKVKRAHSRVTDARGPASSHACIDCGATASHWSYDHADPDEKRSLLHGPFSTKIQHYVARCVPCHKRFDLAHLAKSAS